MKNSKFPLAVEIQTVSACNARCIICPHRQVLQDLPSGVMSMDLFCRIIDQIDPSWGCLIIPYLNNEPLLDPLIIPRLRYVCSKFGNQAVELSTNVSALTPSKQDAMKGIQLKELRLSLFGFTEKTHKLMMPGLKWRVVKQNLDYLVRNEVFRQHIDKISMIQIEHPFVTDEDVVFAQEYCEKYSLSFNQWGFLDRSGNVEYYSNDVHHSIVFGCEQDRPLERMHITFTGDVILCCQDWRWQNVIGNVKHQSILDIWNGSVYDSYRKSVYSGNREQPEICTRCKLSVVCK